MPSDLEFENQFEEKDLEDWLCSNFSSTFGQAVLLGRQIGLRKGDGTAVDVLAISKDGRLCVIELKKEEADAGAITQMLRYAGLLNPPDMEVLDQAVAKQGLGCTSLSAFYQSQFKKELSLQRLARLRLVLVALGFSPDCECLARYLNGVHGMDIRLIRHIPNLDNTKVTFKLKRQCTPGKPFFGKLSAGKDRFFLLRIGANQFFTFDWCAEYGYVVVPAGLEKDTPWATLNQRDHFFAFVDRVGCIGGGTIEGAIRPMDLAWLHADCRSLPFVLPVRWNTRLPRDTAMPIPDDLRGHSGIELMDGIRASKLESDIRAHCAAYGFAPDEAINLSSIALHS